MRDLLLDTRPGWNDGQPPRVTISDSGSEDTQHQRGRQRFAPFPRGAELLVEV